MTKNSLFSSLGYDTENNNSMIAVNLDGLDYEIMINGLAKLGWHIEIHAPVFYLGITRKPFGEYKCVLSKDGMEIKTAGRGAKEAVYKASLMVIDMDDEGLNAGR